MDPHARIRSLPPVGAQASLGGGALEGLTP